MSKRIIKIAIIFNFSLFSLYLYSNYFLTWTLDIARGDIAITEWTPFWVKITSQLHHNIGGSPPGTYGSVIGGIPNYLFVLFLVSMISNMVLLMLALKNK
jgi:hypothetical protein